VRGSDTYNQINRYVARSVQSHWLAIDDDIQGWPDTDRTRLIRTIQVLAYPAPARCLNSGANWLT
ncbi:hypothetical protein APX70_00616, partial [Pseudomonas syringae pv. maculicola]